MPVFLEAVIEEYANKVLDGWLEGKAGPAKKVFGPISVNEPPREEIRMPVVYLIEKPGTNQYYQERRLYEAASAILSAALADVFPRPSDESPAFYVRHDVSDIVIQRAQDSSGPGLEELLKSRAQEIRSRVVAQVREMASIVRKTPSPFDRN